MLPSVIKSSPEYLVLIQFCFLSHRVQFLFKQNVSFVLRIPSSLSPFYPNPDCHCQMGGLCWKHSLELVHITTPTLSPCHRMSIFIFNITMSYCFTYRSTQRRLHHGRTGERTDGPLGYDSRQEALSCSSLFNFVCHYFRQDFDRLNYIPVSFRLSCHRCGGCQFFCFTLGRT